MKTTPYSSRELKLLGADMATYLSEQLKGAVRYDRIAGYFSFSILDVLSADYEAITEVRVVCNADFSSKNAAIKQLVESPQRRDALLKAQWNEEVVALLQKDPAMRIRALKAAELLNSGRLKVRIVPDEAFGFVHAKIGVIHKTGKSSSCFCGSVNESISAVVHNYEALWHSEDVRLIEWAQKEFDALWEEGKDLSQAVIQHITVTAKRIPVSTTDWRTQTRHDTDTVSGVAALTDLPIFQKDGLWPHQVHFVNEAFKYHVYDSQLNRTSGGSTPSVRTAARFVLADQVGLGKTIQMACFAVLASAFDNKPSVIFVPAALKVQWFNELKDKVGVPVAYWDNERWILEDNSVAEAEEGEEPYSLMRLPRKLVIISQGLLQQRPAGKSSNKHKNFSLEALNCKQFACVIIDEFHKIGRKTYAYEYFSKLFASKSRLRQPDGSYYEDACVKSAILGTATPMRLNYEDSWDAFELLATGPFGQHVLGNADSLWRDFKVMKKLTSQKLQDFDDYEKKSLILNPEPHQLAARQLEKAKNSADLEDAYIASSLFEFIEFKDGYVSPKVFEYFTQNFNPIVEYTVLRTRDFLKDALPEIKVKLLEEMGDPLIPRRIPMPTVWKEVHDLLTAEGATHPFTAIVLQRLCSSSAAALLTLSKCLAGEGYRIGLLKDDDEEELLGKTSNLAMTELQQKALVRGQQLLSEYGTDRDPKMLQLLEMIQSHPLFADGGIIFSEYLDTVTHVCQTISRMLPHQKIGLYSNDSATSYYLKGVRYSIKRNLLIELARAGEVKYLVSTKAGQEGLNLQFFKTLVNYDMPWNPGYLEQRKGRIQRIGQKADEVYVYNMLYDYSKDEQIFQKVLQRLQDWMDMYGVVPETIKVTDILNDTGFADPKLNGGGNLFRKKHEDPAIKSTTVVDFRYIPAVDLRTELSSDC